MIKTLDDLVKMAKKKETRRISVAASADMAVLEAVYNAMKEDLVKPILVGDKDKTIQLCKEIGMPLKDITFIDEPNPAKAAQKAVMEVRAGRADILMKGMVGTGALLKAVLDKENGLRKGGLLSHLALFESPYYHKLIGVTDAAMNVAPDFDEKLQILLNAVEAYHKLGIKIPKVAVIGAVETVNPKMEATVHAAMLTQMNQRNQIKGCIVDGPLAIDNAVSKEAAEHKGIVSDVAGDVDICLTPDINAGNVLYKTLGFIGGATSAAVLMGAAVPVVLTSRSDNEKSKMLSIALAAAME